jgi:polyhydroxyalkanoate synthesis regulator phasin
VRYDLPSTAGWRSTEAYAWVPGLEDGQQAQLELAGLRRSLKWTNIQREQLLDRLDLLRLDNQRLQERVDELERQLAEFKQQQALF